MNKKTVILVATVGVLAILVAIVLVVSISDSKQDVNTSQSENLDKTRQDDSNTTSETYAKLAKQDFKLEYPEEWHLDGRLEASENEILACKNEILPAEEPEVGFCVRTNVSNQPYEFNPEAFDVAKEVVATNQFNSNGFTVKKTISKAKFSELNVKYFVDYELKDAEGYVIVLGQASEDEFNQEGGDIFDSVARSVSR